MSDFAILLGGRLERTDRLESQLAGARFIAADGGIGHARLLGVEPELWIGDFDSTTPALQNEFESVPRLAYPAGKAATDGELALEAALNRGAGRIIVVGAMGGTRTDHCLGNLFNALALAEKGTDIFLTSGDEEAYPLLPRTKRVIDLPSASLFSVMGFCDLSGLTIANARYPLENYSLPFGSSRTISNVAEGKVTFELLSGRAIILARPYDMTGI